jgi:hypothetical protein
LEYRPQVAEALKDRGLNVRMYSALATALGIEVPNVTKPGKAIDDHSRINAGLTRVV